MNLSEQQSVEVFKIRLQYRIVGSCLSSATRAKQLVTALRQLKQRPQAAHQTGRRFQRPPPLEMASSYNNNNNNNKIIDQPMKRSRKRSNCWFCANLPLAKQEAAPLANLAGASWPQLARIHLAPLWPSAIVTLSAIGGCCYCCRCYYGATTNSTIGPPTKWSVSCASAAKNYLIENDSSAANNINGPRAKLFARVRLLLFECKYIYKSI